MNIWKGAFAPLTKHCHNGGTGAVPGDLASHVEVNQYDLEETTITVKFSIMGDPSGTVYEAEFEVEVEPGEEVDKATVQQLVADQLKRPRDERTWRKPEIRVESVDRGNEN